MFTCSHNLQKFKILKDTLHHHVKRKEHIRTKGTSSEIVTTHKNIYEKKTSSKIKSSSEEGAFDQGFE